MDGMHRELVGLGFRQRIQDLCSWIRAAVIDNNNFDAVVGMRFQDPLNLLQQNRERFCLVIRRNYYGKLRDIRGYF